MHSTWWIPRMIWQVCGFTYALSFFLLLSSTMLLQSKNHIDRSCKTHQVHQTYYEWSISPTPIGITQSSQHYLPLHTVKKGLHRVKLLDNHWSSNYLLPLICVQFRLALIEQDIEIVVCIHNYCVGLLLFIVKKYTQHCVEIFLLVTIFSYAHEHSRK